MNGYNNKEPKIINTTEHKYICECVRCGKIFERYKGGCQNPPKYCSLYCKNHDTRLLKISICEYCGKKFENTSYRLHRFCSNSCSAKYRGIYAIKHERKIGKDGYTYIYVEGQGSVKEHIYIMEQKLGRKLNKNECVHHIDHNKSNNSIDNLMLLTRSEHSKLHRKEEIEKYGHVKSNMQGWNKGLKMKYPSNNAKKVMCIETGKIYDSARKCAIEMGNANYSVSILHCCHGKQESYKKLHFEFVT